MAHQDVPVSLERVRPTFVAMRKAKSGRAKPLGPAGGNAREKQLLAAALASATARAAAEAELAAE